MACAAFAGIWLLAGCDKPVRVPPPLSQTSPPPVAAKAPLVEPRFLHVEVAIDAGGPSCTTTFTPQPIGSPLKLEHASTCGPAGAVTKLSWKYLGTTQEGDRYEFERVYPLEEPTQSTSRKEVVYQGKDLTVYDDDRSTVRLRPQDKRQGEAVDSRSSM
jgi:hypothetical protein